MCGRYASTRSPEDLAQLFRVTEWHPEEALEPSWNVAPTDDVWAVLERRPRGAGEDAPPARMLRPLRWGLVPSWAKDPRTGARLINARVETVHEKPAFRRAFVKRRCLLPADGVYEWEQVRDETSGKVRKQPYFIHPEDGGVLALAGLYEFWRDPAVKDDDDPAAWLLSCTIITTEATDAAPEAVEEAAAVEDAVARVIRSGLRTKDIAAPGGAAVSTTEMGSAVVAALR